ncbi:hypothetical protein TNCV_3861671 [Trichonephila clavipes]|nr:hypothetical protein TNCV_3861671 [Trichonephila clavipes]
MRRGLHGGQGPEQGPVGPCLKTSLGNHPPKIDDISVHNEKLQSILSSDELQLQTVISFNYKHEVHDFV